MELASKPLTPAVLHILLALSPGERHGYGIMKQVERDSAGRVTMGPGTLYGSIRRMMKDGLVAEGETTPDPGSDGSRRVYYRLTALGQRALADELHRYRVLLAAAGQRQPLTDVVHGS